MVLFWMGRRDAAAAAAEKTIHFADRVGAQHERAWGVRDFVGSLLDGTTPAPDGIRRARSMLELTRGNQQLVAFIERKLSLLYAMRGDRDEARRLVDHALWTYEELGLPLDLASALGFESAGIHYSGGDLDAAEKDQRRAVEILTTTGEKAVLSTLSAMLASVLCAQGKEGEAEEFLEMSRAAAGPYDWVSQMMISGVEAHLHAVQGELDDALALRERAVALVEDTDDIEGQAWQRIELGKLLVSAGRANEAVPLLCEAAELFEAKGHLVGVDTAKQELSALGEASSSQAL